MAIRIADYTWCGGPKVEYDDEAPCLICQQPVGEASMGGTAICPACDCGWCRYCKERLFAIKEEIDGGSSLRRLREHVQRCKEWWETRI